MRIAENIADRTEREGGGGNAKFDRCYKIFTMLEVRAIY